MKQTRVVVDTFDDIEYRATGTRTPAEVTVTLSWDGSTVELDLTKDHKTHLDDLIGPYLAMGRKVKDEPRARRQQRNTARNRAMRAFADEHQSEHPDWMYHKNNDGTYGYPRPLREAFAEHEASLAGSAANAAYS